MSMNYDMLAFDSRLPAFKNDDSGSFTISISGTVAVSGTGSFTASTSFSHNNRMVRYSMQQNVVPSGAGYTINDRLPAAIMSSSGNFPLLIGATVSGSPSVTNAAADIYITSTLTGVTATVKIHNPYAASMVLTATVLTIYYTAFAAFGES